MKTTKWKKAYWFSSLDGTTEYQRTPAETGRIDKVSGEIVPCFNGLHASPTPWDALQYASGPRLWVVWLRGDVVADGSPTDKFAASERKYGLSIDATKLLRKFAAQRAWSVIDQWSPPEVVKEYLRDEMKGVDRSDIRNAAMDAVRDFMAAARVVAWVTVWTAARAASTDADKKSFNKQAMELLRSWRND